MTNGNGAPPEQAPPQLNVLAQYTKDLSFENPNAPASLAPQQQQPAINIQINVSANNLSESEFEVTLSIEGKAENAGNGPGGRAFHQGLSLTRVSLGTAEITSSIETAACRHETTPGQWRVLARVNCSAFWRRGETRSCPEITHIQLFRVHIGRPAGPD